MLRVMALIAALASPAAAAPGCWEADGGPMNGGIMITPTAVEFSEEICYLPLENDFSGKPVDTTCYGSGEGDDTPSYTRTMALSLVDGVVVLNDDELSVTLKPCVWH